MKRTDTHPSTPIPRVTKGTVHGLATVEFTVVSLAFFILLFACIEVGRLMLMTNQLSQMTRIAARLGAVCTPEDANIFDIAAQHSSLTGQLGTTNLHLEYLTGDFTPIASPADNVVEIEFVRASIRNYSFRSVIPLFNFGVALPSQTTTVPSESLGVLPGGGNYDC